MVTYVSAYLLMVLQVLFLILPLFSFFCASQEFSWYRDGLDDRGVLAGARDFSLLHSIQAGFGAHPASYHMGARDFFHGGKVAGQENYLLPPHSAEVKNV
jgi:hypothetical protein